MRSCFIAPDLVHAVRWAKRVYDPVIAPSNPLPRRFFAVFNQPLPARPLLHLAHFGRAAPVLLFCLASRSRLIAPDLVHAVRWAKRVYDPVIAPRRILRRPHRIIVCNNERPPA